MTREDNDREETRELTAAMNTPTSYTTSWDLTYVPSSAP